MCGRFALHHTREDLHAAYMTAVPPPVFPPRYNIAPSQDVIAVIRAPADAPGGRGTAGRLAVMCRWGLVPAWAGDPAIGARTINARAETAADKPAFRAAMRRRRCLIPASGFYEWRAAGEGGKQPFWIARADGGLVTFAGLWEVWTSPDGSELRTCAILTTAANAALSPVHHRMPVMLRQGDFDGWLGSGSGAEEGGEARAAAALLAGAAGADAGAALEIRPVGRAVNAVRNDGQDLVAPVPEGRPAPAQGELF